MHSGARKRLARRRNEKQKQIVAESRRREEEAALKRPYEKFPSENTLPTKEASPERAIARRALWTNPPFNNCGRIGGW